MHILPRQATDFEGDNDAMYPALEANEAEMRGEMEERKGRLEVPKDEDRRARSDAEMSAEAKWLAGVLVEHSR